MKIVKAGCIIVDDIDGKRILQKLEACGRTAYKSEHRITPDSAPEFIGRLIRMGHESVLEHVSVSVRFLTDRSTSHQIVRHRLASYTQESQRYINYTNQKFGGHVVFVCPSFLMDRPADCEQAILWKEAMENAEKAYFALIEAGAYPQEARSVLPNSTKTELVMTANLREWRHFLKMRLSKGAHPDIRMLAEDLLDQFQSRIPVVFDDIKEED